MLQNLSASCRRGPKQMQVSEVYSTGWLLGGLLLMFIPFVFSRIKMPGFDFVHVSRCIMRMNGWMKFVSFQLQPHVVGACITPSITLFEQQFVSWETQCRVSCRWYASGHPIWDVADGQPCMPIRDTSFRHRGKKKWRDRNRHVEKNNFRSIELGRNKSALSSPLRETVPGRVPVCMPKCSSRFEPAADVTIVGRK